MLWLLFPLIAFAKFDGSNVTCPKGKYSEVGQTPVLRFKSNNSHILVCGKKGKQKGEKYYLENFEVFYYHPEHKRLMPPMITTLKNERYEIYPVNNSLFFVELAYDGVKRVPVFRNSILCAKNGDCSLATLECVFDKRKSAGIKLPGTLKERLEQAKCI